MGRLISWFRSIPWRDLTFRSRRALIDRYCAKGWHVYVFSFWHEAYQFRAGSPLARGWVTTCVVCKADARLDPNSPRKWGGWKAYTPFVPTGSPLGTE